MPMVSTMPAMPGSVSVAPSSDSAAMIMRDVNGERDVGEEAEEAVGHEHEADDQHGGDHARDLAGADEVRTEARPDRALLDDGRASPAARRRAAAPRDRWRSAT